MDKPYCCKLPGCNKRYTDPSSLRKHVKTYKHFATEEPARRESSDGIQSPEAFSPVKDPYAHTEEPISPLYSNYSPPGSAISPPLSYNPILLRDSAVPVGYPTIDQVRYVKPLESMYPMRVPSNEMSYMEYTQMYEHTYRNYYSGSINYPVLRQSVSEKAYTYEEQPRYEDAPMKEVTNTDNYSHKDEEMPLNLICAKQRIECKPIEELVRRTDLPLDLSTKS